MKFFIGMLFILLIGLGPTPKVSTVKILASINLFWTLKFDKVLN